MTLLDAGTPGLDLVTYLHGREMVILIDAVSASGPPGELRLYRNGDLDKMEPQPRVSPHDPVVREALWIAELAGDGPRVLLVGVIPESTEIGARLSAPVHAAASVAGAVVIEELGRLGAAPQPRPQPSAPDPWWMRGAPPRAV